MEVWGNPNPRDSSPGVSSPKQTVSCPERMGQSIALFTLRLLNARMQAASSPLPAFVSNPEPEPLDWNAEEILRREC